MSSVVLGRRGSTPRSEGFVGGRRKEKEKRGKKEREKEKRKERKEKLKRTEREGRELCRFSVLKGGLVCAPTGRGSSPTMASPCLRAIQWP